MKNSSNFRMRGWPSFISVTHSQESIQPKNPTECLCAQPKVSCVQSDKTKSITKCIRICSESNDYATSTTPNSGIETTTQFLFGWKWKTQRNQNINRLSISIFKSTSKMIWSGKIWCEIAMRFVMFPKNQNHKNVNVEKAMWEAV